jgi:hypothetical protein
MKSSASLAAILVTIFSLIPALCLKLGGLITAPWWWVILGTLILGLVIFEAARRFFEFLDAAMNDEMERRDS